MGPKKLRFGVALLLALLGLSCVAPAQSSLPRRLRVHLRVSASEFVQLEQRMQRFCEARQLRYPQSIRAINWGFPSQDALPSSEYWDVAIGYPGHELIRRESRLAELEPAASGRPAQYGRLCRVLAYVPLDVAMGELVTWQHFVESTATPVLAPDAVHEPEFLVALAQIARAPFSTALTRIEAARANPRLFSSFDVRLRLGQAKTGFGIVVLQADERHDVGALPAARHYAMLSRRARSPEIARALLDELVPVTGADWLEFGLGSADPALTRLLPAPGPEELAEFKAIWLGQLPEQEQEEDPIETVLLLVFGGLFLVLLLGTFGKLRRA
jgi:hypothetical protein